MAAVVSLFSSSRRSHERERGRVREEGGKRGKTGGGNKGEGEEGGAGGHRGSAPAKLRLARTPPLFVHSAHPAAGLLPASSRFIVLPSQKPRSCGGESGASRAHRLRVHRRG